MVIVRESDVVRVVGALAPETSNARAYFKRTVNRNATRIATTDIQSTVGNIPVIKRGSTGYRPVMKGGITYIEPQPIEIDDYFSAVEEDDWERASNMGKNQIVDERLARWAKLVRNTTKALCIQAHRGAIDYMMQAGNEMVRYEVDYGDVEGIERDKALSSLTLADFIEDASEMEQAINDRGIGGAIEFIASTEYFKQLVSISANQTMFPVEMTADGMNIAGFKVLRNNDTYTDLASGTKTVKKLVESRELMARAVDAGQELDFLRIDDTVQRQAVPLYSFTKERGDQRGTDLYVKSKPFPLINVKGIEILRYAS